MFPLRCFAAGTTLLFTETLNGYPAGAGTMVFSMNKEGTNIAAINATASGDDFIVTAAAATTAAWPPGEYFWSMAYTNTATGAVTQARSGKLSVTPNYAVSATPTATQAQLAALDAAILAIISNPALPMSVSFAGQSTSFRSLKEMLDARDRLQARVDAELRAMGLTRRGGAQTIVTRFDP